MSQKERTTRRAEIAVEELSAIADVANSTAYLEMCEKSRITQREGFLILFAMIISDGHRIISAIQSLAMAEVELLETEVENKADDAPAD
jgi:hypothetical protein